ncbi:gliding motility protein GldB [Parabacteroides sp. OttesenSCG-928-N08]|nr:gliding motility protein GldB [Parabacteroides sp. OttesenSCG-928-N08]
MHKSSFILLLLLCFSSCKTAGSHPYADAEPIRIQRFDKILFSYLETGDDNRLQAIRRQYPEMLQLIAMGIFNQRSTDNEQFAERLLNYYSEPTLAGLYRDALAAYDEIDDIEQQMGSAFACLRDLFPAMQLPTVNMHISGLHQNVLVGQQLLSISIDKYLGSDYPLYKEFFYPFQRIKMQRENITADYLTGLLMSEFPFKGKESILLERMVYEGKIKWVVALAYPEIDEASLLGMSEESFAWCKENEAELWKFIIENKHLYTPDLGTTNNYFEDMPAGFIAAEAPPGIGKWIGWQIVAHYMQRSNSTPEFLMNNQDAQSILTQSKYRP